MHAITRRLIHESRTRSAGERHADRAVSAVVLLYDRLSPVIGRGGFNALLRRATRSLGERYDGLRAVASEGELDAILDALGQVRTNGSADADAVVRDLLDELVSTLERMIGPDLTRRLVDALEVGAEREETTDE